MNAKEIAESLITVVIVVKVDLCYEYDMYEFENQLVIF